MSLFKTKNQYYKYVILTEYVVHKTIITSLRVFDHVARGILTLNKKQFYKSLNVSAMLVTEC